MQSKKKILIDTLNGSLSELRGLPEQILNESIYDDKGYVDLEFFTGLMSYMAANMTISNKIMKACQKLLGIEEESPTKKEKSNAGANWSVEDTLKRCSLENGVIRLPQVALNRKVYEEVKKCMENAGGSWTGGSVQGFTFPFDPSRVFSFLHEGKRINLAQEFQFFETPDSVADWLVSLVGGFRDEDAVLEPSAGRGALVRAIHRLCPKTVVDCYEAMPENREILQKMDGIRIVGEDFIKTTPAILYDKIIANPPFSKNQDITHVLAMYDRLAPDGVLAAIMSRHWQFAEESQCQTFREWTEKVNASVYVMDKGEFKESGTSISTCAIVVTKTQNQ